MRGVAQEPVMKGPPQPAGLAVPAARNAAAAAAGLTAAPSGVPSTFLRLLSGTSLPPGVGRDGLGGTGAPCDISSTGGRQSDAKLWSFSSLKLACPEGILLRYYAQKRQLSKLIESCGT